MRVTIRGVTYDSVAKAAKKLKVKPATVYSALHRGTTDTVGLGTGARKIKRGGNPKPITIGHLHFKSIGDASVYLGYERKSLSQILRRGGEVSRQNIMRRLLEKSAKTENSLMRASMRVNEN